MEKPNAVPLDLADEIFAAHSKPDLSSPNHYDPVAEMYRYAKKLEAERRIAPQPNAGLREAIARYLCASVMGEGYDWADAVADHRVESWLSKADEILALLPGSDKGEVAESESDAEIFVRLNLLEDFVSGVLAWMRREPGAAKISIGNAENALREIKMIRRSIPKRLDPEITRIIVQAISAAIPIGGEAEIQKAPATDEDCVDVRPLRGPVIGSYTLVPDHFVDVNKMVDPVSPSLVIPGDGL